MSRDLFNLLDLGSHTNAKHTGDDRAAVGIPAAAGRECCALLSFFKLGKSFSLIEEIADKWIALGITSFEDCPMFT